MKNYFKGTSFLDLLFNILLLFFAMFILSYTQIRIEESKANLKTKAEFVITLTWDSNNIDDVDLWIRDPLDNVMFFRKLHIGMMHLDRDDRGKANDTITLPNGTTVVCPINQEIATIRGIVPGEWIINIHMYNKKDTKPANVEVKMVKLNPTFTEIFTKRLVMAKSKEEITIARFTMTISGEVIGMLELHYEMVKDELVAAGYLSQEERGGAGI